MRTVTLLLALVLAACGAQPAGEPPTVPPTAVQPTGEATGDPEVTTPDTPPPTAETETGMDPEATDTITGTFNGDATLEGGCAWVEAGGERYELMLPDGYEIDTSEIVLLGPDGDVVAQAGDEVRMSGSVATDVMSFCQVGQMFRVTEIAPA